MLCIFLYSQAYCLSGTLPFSKGQTIGKTIVGIKTLHASTAGDIEVFNLEQRLVRLVPRPLGVIRYYAYTVSFSY